jgi:hypothetical protein
MGTVLSVRLDEIPHGDGEPRPSHQLHSLQEDVPQLARREQHEEPPAPVPLRPGDRQEHRRLRGQGLQGDGTRAHITHSFEVVMHNENRYIYY